MHILYYQDTMIKSDGAEAPASVQGYIKAVESTRNLKLVDCVSLEASESGNTGAEVYKLYFKRAPVEGAEAEVDNHDLERLVVKMVETHKINFSPAFRAKAMERLIMYLYGYTDARMFKLEINFYQRWKPRFDEIGKQKDGEASMSLFPDLAYAEFHPDTSPFSANKMIWLGWRQKATGGIVMEDLSSKGRFLRATSTEIDLEPLKLMCSAAATFSGRSVRLLKDTPTHRTFQYTLTMMNSGLLLALKRLHFGKGITKKVKKLWGSSMLKILEEDQELIHALEMLETRFSPCKRVFPIWCIVHGDLHAQNFSYFSGDKPHVKMFDMQMWGIGSPAIEFAYFLSSNVDPDDVEREKQLFEVYHQALIESAEDEWLTKSYSLDRFKRDVRTAQLEFAVAALVRRSRFETPTAVKRAIAKDGKVVEKLQKVLVDREIRFLRMVKRIWRVDPRFNLETLDQI